MGTPESTKAIKQLIFERPIAKAVYYAALKTYLFIFFKMRPFGHAKIFKILICVIKKFLL